MSAETVSSLVGEAGVEAQFARRFSYIRGIGSLVDRALFKNKGARIYVDAVRVYARAVLEDGLNRLTALGVNGAAKEADEWLRVFHEEHGLSRHHKALNDTVANIAKDISDAIGQVCEYMLENPDDAKRCVFMEPLTGIPREFKSLLDDCIEVVTWNDKAVCLVSRLSKLCSMWIDGTFDKSEAVKVSFKRSEIAKLVDQQLFPDRSGETTKVKAEAYPQGKTVRGTIYSLQSHL
jgi:hypothetical protein